MSNPNQFNKGVALGIVFGAVAGITTSVAISWLKPATDDPKHQKSPRIARSPAELLAAHDTETSDPSWAPSAARMLELDLDEIGGKFDIVSVDCRRSSCVAALRWKSARDAQADMKPIAHHQYTTKCTVTVNLEPLQSDSSEPYAGKVIYAPCDREF